MKMLGIKKEKRLGFFSGQKIWRCFIRKPWLANCARNNARFFLGGEGGVGGWGSGLARFPPRVKIGQLMKMCVEVEKEERKKIVSLEGEWSLFVCAESLFFSPNLMIFREIHTCNRTNYELDTPASKLDEDVKIWQTRELLFFHDESHAKKI